MEATVTLSLKDFKEIEQRAEVYYQIHQDNTVIVHWSAFGSYAVKVGDAATAQLVKDLKSAIEMRDKTISDVREYERINKVKVFKY